MEIDGNVKVVSCLHLLLGKGARLAEGRFTGKIREISPAEMVSFPYLILELANNFALK